MPRRTGILLLALLLAGCAAAGTPEPGLAPEAAAGTLAGPSRLLMALPEGSRLTTLRPVDPATLADLAGFSPIRFNTCSPHAFAPDGQTLAFIRCSGAEQGAALHLVDVETWKEQAVSLGRSVERDWAGYLSFSADGSALYWIENIMSGQGVPPSYVLHRHSRTDYASGVLTKLPVGFVPHALHLLPGGLRAAVFGQPVTAEHLPDGDSRVLLIRLSDGTIEAEIPLPGVVAGRWRTADGMERYTQPGLAWDPARSLLYVVDGAPDRVTVVDLREGRLARRAELRSVSWLERLGVVRVAAAKALPGTSVEAVLSPGGERLYVAAFREEVEGLHDTPAAPSVGRGTPLGLTVIDTGDLWEIGKLDLPVSNLALAPGGSRLLLWGASWECETGCRREGHGVYVVDTAKLTRVAHVLPGNEATVLGFSPDGRYAYIGEDTGRGVHHRVLDLAKGRLGDGRAISQGHAYYVQ